MRNLVTMIIMMLACGNANAQDLSSTSLEAVSSQVAAKARLFCKYIVAVGSSPGQKGAVSEAEKNRIIRSRVPKLFYNYPARYMLVTNGRNGEVVKRRNMSAYFSSLRAQSVSGAGTGRSYELHFVGVKPPTGKGKEILRLKEKTADGCTVYSSTIVVEQIYHHISWSPEGAVIREERDMKEMEVLVTQKPTGKAEVLLGDVRKAYRIK